MAASHRNPYNKRVISRFLSENLGVQSAALMFEATGMLSSELTPQEIQAVLSKTVSEALIEFRKLCIEAGIRGIPAGGTELHMCGMEGLEVDSDMLNNIHSLASNHRALHGGVKGRTIQLKVASKFLGKRGGLIYGGNNHPQLHRVGFYS